MKYALKLKSPVRWAHGRHKIIENIDSDAKDDERKRIRKMTSRNQIIFKFVLRFAFGCCARCSIHKNVYEPISVSRSSPATFFRRRRRKKKRFFFGSRFEISLLPLWAQWSRLTILPAAIAMSTETTSFQRAINSFIQTNRVLARATHSFLLCLHNCWKLSASLASSICFELRNSLPIIISLRSSQLINFNNFYVWFIGALWTEEGSKCEAKNYSAFN